MDRFIEEHPVLLFVIVFVILFIVIWVKMCIDEKKGVNSVEKQKIHKILSRVIYDYDEYTPVYAYYRQSYGRHSVKCQYYAIGLTLTKMYIVPLTFSENEVGYGEAKVIQKSDLGKIDCGKPGGPIHFLKFYDKNEKIIFEVTVEEKNTKLDQSYPVNISQVEETRTFMRKLEQWCKDV